MTTVLHPGHTGADTPCPGTAYDADTAAYIPCTHPSHAAPTTDLERLAAENVELRDALARWKGVAALYQQAARDAATTTRSDVQHG